MFLPLYKFWNVLVDRPMLSEKTENLWDIAAVKELTRWGIDETSDIL